MKKIYFILMLLLLVPQIVYPHAYLMETQPEEGAVLSKPPQIVILQFLGTLEHVFFGIAVFDKEGVKVSDKAQLKDIEDGSAIGAKLTGELKSGEYTVKWHGMSKDGHRQKGIFLFTIK
ncbi:MAG TPA: copper resistance protein CopC [bacterium]|nr:copper resistance protein CopC [bacterium]